MPKWYEGSKVIKDPSDVIDVKMDFGPILASDTISAATVSGTNITIDSTSTAGSAVTSFISGGFNGTEGELRFNISTTGGRVFERTIIVDVKEL